MPDVKDLILYEDKSIIVVNKPAGIAVQNSSFGTLDLESMLRNYLASSGQGGDTGRREIPYLAVVHRLDQPVAGVMVFAKTKKAAADLSRQMQVGMMNKEYLAVVRKTVSRDFPGGWVTLTDFLLRDGRTNTSRIVPEGTVGAKEAKLSCRVQKACVRVGETEGMLLEVRLFTGRHHQIRVQLAGAGMPILGDRKYGLPEEKGQLCLAAYRLKFRHPATGREMEFEAVPAFLGQ